MVSDEFLSDVEVRLAHEGEQSVSLFLEAECDEALWCFTGSAGLMPVDSFLALEAWAEGVTLGTVRCLPPLPDGFAVVGLFVDGAVL